MSLKGVVNFVTSPIGFVAGAIFGKKVGQLVRAAGMIAVGIYTGNPQMILAGLATGASALQKKPKTSNATTERLNASMDPNAPRKIVFGRTAMATDIRYAAYTGTDQEYYEAICAVASHEVEAIEEIWFDSEIAWTSAGGAQGRFAGYLTVVTRLVGTAANGIAIDSKWTSACTLTGCAYFHAKFKLTGNSKKTESPFAQAIPSRWTVRGKGAKVPDPRLSTGAGGSGAQDMADQSTWAYTTAADSGRNPACEILFYLLGYKIGGKLAVGMGCPSTRVDYASFITAANINDESVAKAGGGTESRYRSDGIFSEDDEPETVLGGLLQAMNAELTDEGGKIGIRVDYDDLATVAVAFTTQDILDGDDWKPSEAAQDVNVVRGRFTDPSDGALYQMADYPQVTLTGADWGSPDGIQRIETFDLACVQSPSQAQRLAKLRLQRKQYPGMFSARFNMRAWAASYGRIVTLTHASLGFSAKKFRVAGQMLRMDGSVDLVLREVNTAQYAWAAEEAAVAAPAVPTAYNPLNSPVIDFLSTVAEGADVSLPLARVSGVSEADLAILGGTLTNTGTNASYTRAAVGPLMSGPVAAKMKIAAGAFFHIVALDLDITGSDYSVQSIILFYRESDGNCQVYMLGVGKTLDTAPGAGKTGDIEVRYDEDAYECWIGDTRVYRAAGVGPGLKHYPKWWAYNTGVTYTGLRLGYYVDHNFVNMGGVTRPDLNATKNEAVVQDDFGYPTAALLDAQWEGVSGGAVSVGGFNNVTDTSVSSNKYNRIGDNAGNDHCHLVWRGDPIPYDPNLLYEIEIVCKQLNGTGVAYVGVEGLNTDKTTVVDTAGSTSRTSFHYVCIAGTTPAASFTSYKGYLKGRSGTGSNTVKSDPTAPGTVHSNVAFIRPVIRFNAPSNAGTFDVDKIVIRRITQLAEIGAAVNSWIEGDSVITIQADYQGTVLSGELTRDVPYKLYRNGVLITSGITWSRTLVSGTATTSIAGTGTGTLSITAFTSEAKVLITATYAGAAVATFTATIVKDLQDAPVSGGAGSTTASTSTITGTSSSSYGAANAGPLTIRAPAGGAINYSAALNYKRTTSTSGSSGAHGKVQWRIVGGVFADVVAETASSSDATTLNEPPVQQAAGALSISGSKTGLVAGSDYEFQLLLRSDGATQINFTGNFEVHQ